MSPTHCGNSNWDTYHAVIQTVYCGGGKEVTPAPAAVIDTRLPQPEARQDVHVRRLYIDRASIP